MPPFDLGAFAAACWRSMRGVPDRAEPMRPVLARRRGLHIVYFDGDWEVREGERFYPLGYFDTEAHAKLFRRHVRWFRAGLRKTRPACNDSLYGKPVWRPCSAPD